MNRNKIANSRIKNAIRKVKKKLQEMGNKLRNNEKQRSNKEMKNEENEAVSGRQAHGKMIEIERNQEEEKQNASDKKEQNTSNKIDYDKLKSINILDDFRHSESKQEKGQQKL